MLPGSKGCAQRVRRGSCTSADAAALGITEIVYTPAGPDIVGEIEAFANAIHG